MISKTEAKFKPGYKYTSFGWIPVEWEIYKLDEVSEKIQDGTHFSPKINQNGVYKYITSKNIKSGYLNLENVDYISEEEHKQIYERCNVKFGDILITKDGAST
nr:restriction endonuclease subunit S [Saprospiraceae bacterium]